MLLLAPQCCSSTTELTQEETNTKCLIRVFITTYENICLQPVPSVPGIVYPITLQIPILLTHLRLVQISIRAIKHCSMIVKPIQLEPEIDQNVILKFSCVISLGCNKDTDTEVLAPASLFHYCILYMEQKIHQLFVADIS